MRIRTALAVLLAAAFLSFVPLASSTQPAGAPLGVADACADGSCRTVPGWLCNIGGGEDHGDKCRWNWFWGCY